MCGIGGYFAGNSGGLRGPDTLWKIVAALRHRGPDDEGIWLSDGGAVGLAHTRLAIIDVSSAGHQPMVSESGRFALSFNGEIYNYRTMAAELAKDGFIPKGHSDTEVFLAGCERWGIESTLRRAAGMFALAVVDQSTRTLTLARDRLGEKPLYLAQSGSSYLFASELGALAALPGVTGEIDATALRHYLQRNYIPAPWTIYSNVRKVEPGTFVRLRNTSAGVVAEVTRYWNPPGYPDAQGSQPSPAGIEELEAALRTTVREQMISDRPLGAFLSGGVDSSLVAMLMQEESAHPVKTFTIGFEDDSFNELPFARETARRLGTDHHEIMLTPEAGLALIDELPRVYSEPFADASQIPTLLVAREARRHVVVALSGDGGDENFAGYDRYFEVLSAWGRLEALSAPGRRVLRRLLQLGDRTWLDGSVAAVVNRLAGRNPARRVSTVFRHAAHVLGAQSLEDRYLMHHNVWARPEEVMVGHCNATVTASAAAASPSMNSAVRRMMAIDLRCYLPDDILVKVDRASMSVGLECRAPLLDHRVVEVAWRLDPKLLCADGRGKYPLRKLLYSRLPPALFERRKQGFAVPIGQWLRSSLREWAEDLLSEQSLSRDAPMLRSQEIRRRWTEHLAGVWDNSALLWGTLQLVRWQRTRGMPAPSGVSSVRISAKAS